MALVTEHRAECDRCDVTEQTTNPELPSGWKTVKQPYTDQLKVLCNRCSRALRDWIDYPPEPGEVA